MKEKRSLEISCKVFSKEDIERIATVVANSKRPVKDSEVASPFLGFDVDCHDRTSYSSDSLEIFGANGVLETKRIDSIRMTLHDYKLGQTISIVLKQGDTILNSLQVEGNDHAWVAGVFTSLKELIDAVRPQHWITRHKTMTLNLAAIGIGFVICLLVAGFSSPSSATAAGDKPSYLTVAILQLGAIAPWIPSAVAASLLLTISYVFGLPFALFFRDWLYKLWPDVEFDFGPEHTKLEKQRRIRIAFIMTIIVVPVLIRIAYDTARSLIAK